MGLIELDRPIAFQRVFVTLTGSINAALMLSQANYWACRTKDPAGWFYKTGDEWQEETGLTRREREDARKKLRSIGILEEKLTGVPAKLHYRLIESKIRQLLAGVAQTSMCKTDKLVCTKPPNWNGGNRQTNTETTTETTTYINTLSGKPDGAQTAHSKESVKEIIVYLNESCGKQFKPTETNLKFVSERLKEGYTADECRSVITEKAREWRGTEFEKFLRPETLFNKTKFSSYFGELWKSKAKSNDFNVWKPANER